MRCRDVRMRLSAYGDGELPSAMAARVRDHLAGCEQCANESRALAGLWSLLEFHSLPAPGPGFMASVRSRLATRRAGRLRPVTGSPPLLRGALATAAVLGAVVLGMTLGLRSAPTGGAAATAGVGSTSGLAEWRVGSLSSAPRDTVGGVYFDLTGLGANAGEVD
jgi:anti-sigma factor RsiW